jgi:hypothetical protein
MAVSTSVFSRCKAISVIFTCGRIVEPYTATRKWHREETLVERLADERGADRKGRRRNGGRSRRLWLRDWI